MKIYFDDGKDEADLLADNLKGYAIQIEAWGLAGVVERRAIAGAQKKKLISHLNADGSFVFTAEYGHEDSTAAAEYFSEQLAMQGRQDTVRLVDNSDEDFAFMREAILESVQRIAWNNGRLRIRYTFAINGIDLTLNGV